MKSLNMLGKPCPIPVVEAKKVLASPKEPGVEVIVDNIVAVQNLQKMADGLGYTFTHRQTDDSIYTVEILQQAGSIAPVPAQKAKPEPVVQQANGVDASAPVVLITTNSMGTGSEELGKILMKGFIYSLTELSPAPSAVLFLNGGVHLTCEGSNALGDLQALQQKGCRIASCGTCLNYYSLTESLRAGEIIDMMGIANTLATVAKVITI